LEWWRRWLMVGLRRFGGGWSAALGWRISKLKDVSSKCSTERELVNTCADIYVNCNPRSSWKEIALTLHRVEETAAVEEVRSYLNPRGRCSQWVGITPTFIVLIQWNVNINCRQP
jgi:predicted metalloprotease